jgi:hypothetical protein
MAALEIGAMAYARGVIDNWLAYYVRSNGGITYRAEEVAVSSRMLTLFALYVSYADGDDEQKDAEALMLSHFDKAKALGEWLLYRYNQSLSFPPMDPRHGIPAGDDEADTFIGYQYTDASPDVLPHFYSSAVTVPLLKTQTTPVFLPTKIEDKRSQGLSRARGA